MHNAITALLHYLDRAAPHAAHRWREWQVAPISGGANNLLYRATSSTGDYAIKFTVRDERQRAQREYVALRALEQAEPALAPAAILLDQHRYRQPVIVQRWLTGAALEAPPRTTAGWEALIDHYCAIHRLTPARTTIAIADAVLNVSDGQAGKVLVQQHAARLPPAAQPASLVALLAVFARWSPPPWPTPPRALCRVDANWRNFISRPGAWASVDWENSGWGDPAFDLADLITHPSYDHPPEAGWDHLVARYAEQYNDATVAVRVSTYSTIMCVWWAVRWARYLYEVPRGLDPRLVKRPPHWLDHAQRMYAQAIERATAVVAAL